MKLILVVIALFAIVCCGVYEGQKEVKEHADDEIEMKAFSEQLHLASTCHKSERDSLDILITGVRLEETKCKGKTLDRLSCGLNCEQKILDYQLQQETLMSLEMDSIRKVK